MSIYDQFRALGNKQLTLQEGLNDMRQIQSDLSQTSATSNAWGNTAVLTSAVLIPLNIIINSFDLKAANGVYQVAVRTLYNRYAASGTRINSGVAGGVLKTLKDAIIDELKRKALGEFVPGVNIIIGLTEDSIALVQTAQTVSNGSQEAKNLMRMVQNNIDRITREIQKIGIMRAHLLEQMEQMARFS